MGNSVSHPHCTTRRQLLPVLRRSRDYRGVQKMVARRLRVNKATVSKAASGRWPGRYQRIELALLKEMCRHDHEAFLLLEKLEAQKPEGTGAEARNDGRKG